MLLQQLKVNINDDQKNSSDKPTTRFSTSVTFIQKKRKEKKMNYF